ncbi:class I adenylate-forming enzyme family protein [Streptomyces sp. NPDC050856]|uniref:class I adenylate-forming enzyme family protein n=1 Tax=Streptomyces sp. NPDC050856 TaxID=3154939 RepID=UPI0033F979C2
MSVHTQAPITLSEAVFLAAERHPGTPLVADAEWAGTGKEVLDHAGLARFVGDFADRLWTAGVRPGTRVAVVKRDHIDVQALAAAAVRIGAVPALLSGRLDVQDVLALLDRLDEPVLLTDAYGAGRLAPVRAEVSRLTASAWSVDGTRTAWIRPLAAGEEHRPHRNPDGAEAIITHSSGTTGLPKLIAQSTASLHAHAVPTLRVAQRTGPQTEFSLRCISPTHTRASSALLGNLVMGTPLVAVADPGTAHVRELLLTHRPVSVESHPNLFLLWESLTEDPDRPFAQVRRFVSTFDAIHPRTVRALLNASDQPDAVYLQGYGQTETGPTTLRVITRADLDGVSGRNVGSPIPGVSEVRVTGEDGEPVPPGTAGTIEVRTEGLSLGYVGGAAPPRDGWWSMQDVGRLLENGELELLDRVVDRADGVASLLEAEDALLEALPPLCEVVLVKPEGDSLAAVVCVRDGSPLDREAWDRAAGRLGLAGVPVHETRWEDIPFTGSWKVRRRLLARSLAGRPAAAPAGLPGKS